MKKTSRSRRDWSRWAAPWIPTSCSAPTARASSPGRRIRRSPGGRPTRARSSSSTATNRTGVSIAQFAGAAGRSRSIATSRGVMRRCAAATPDRPATWITDDFVASYSELHRRGHAHSVEVWEGDELVGGLYGVTSAASSAANRCSTAHRRVEGRRRLPDRAAARVRLHAARRAGADAAPGAAGRDQHPARRVPRAPATRRSRSGPHSARRDSRAAASGLCRALRTQTRLRPAALGRVHRLVGAAIEIGGRLRRPGRGGRATPTLMVTRIGLSSYDERVRLDRRAQALGQVSPAATARCRAR